MYRNAIIPDQLGTCSAVPDPESTRGFGGSGLTFGLSGSDISVVYPLTASAPLFTLAFTALLLKGTERLTWGIVIGASAVVAGVIFL